MVKLNWNNKVNIFEENKEIEDRKTKLVKFELFPKYLTLLENEWKNSLYWGDNLAVSLNLLNQFEEKIKLIYIDPPFDVEG